MSDTPRPMCFLGMPCGRGSAERLAYRQWRTQVLELAIDAAGYIPWVSELDAAPADIAAEILRNVVEAPMAVFDLGGFEPGDAVNVNVMYELGIRHAFHKPAIVYSPDRTLPFDVQAGRAILAPRTLADADAVTEAIAAAIVEAEAGRFWKPMSTVASLDRLHDILAKSSELAPLTEIVLAMSRDMKALRTEVRERGRYTFADLSNYEPVNLGQMFNTPVDSSGRLRSIGDSIGRSGWDAMMPSATSNASSVSAISAAPAFRSAPDVPGTPVDSTGRLRPLGGDLGRLGRDGGLPRPPGTAKKPSTIRTPPPDDAS